MSFERRPDRRGGRPGGRTGGGRAGGAPRDRGDRPQRDFGDRPQRDFGDRPQRDFGERAARNWGDQQRNSYSRVPRSGARTDDGGMSIRLDPRRLAALKLLAAEAGVRPGELVTRWVEQRLDEARNGQVPAAGAGSGADDAVAQLAKRLDAIEQRLDRMGPGKGATAAAPSPDPAPSAAGTQAAEAQETPRKRGRPRKTPATPSATETPARIPLHEEIEAVIRERGPMSAADLAAAIVERGRYAAPRSSRPLDAATVNSRVSNPAYRSRFARRDGRIDLAPSS